MNKIVLLTDNSPDTGLWLEVDEDRVRLIGGVDSDNNVHILPDVDQGLDMPREYAEKVWGPLEQIEHDNALDEFVTA